MKRCSHNESLMAEVTSASKRLQPGLRAVGPDVMEATYECRHGKSLDDLCLICYFGADGSRDRIVVKRIEA